MISYIYTIDINTLYVYIYIHGSGYLRSFWIVGGSPFSQVLSTGIHPRTAHDGSPLPAAHMKHAGLPISGNERLNYI